ncbi:hypothetical protein ACFL1B_01960 [Nanoarchaeota archaeon]
MKNKYRKISIFIMVFLLLFFGEVFFFNEPFFVAYLILWLHEFVDDFFTSLIVFLILPIAQFAFALLSYFRERDSDRRRVFLVILSSIFLVFFIVVSFYFGVFQTEETVYASCITDSELISCLDTQIENVDNKVIVSIALEEDEKVEFIRGSVVFFSYSNSFRNHVNANHCEYVNEFGGHYSCEFEGNFDIGEKMKAELIFNYLIEGEEEEVEIIVDRVSLI